MNAGIAAYVILSQNTDVTNIVGVNIFPEVAEQETATPFIVYQLLSVAPEDTHDGPSTLDEVRFEFLCYADSYALAADLGSKVRGALDRVSGTYNGVNVESIQFNDVDIDTIDAPRRFAQVLTFTFRIKRDNVEIAQGTPVTGAKLGDLYDVDTTGVTDGQVIAYDAAAQEWQPADDAGGVTQLGQLTDVQFGQGGPEIGELLKYDGSEWTNDSLNKSEIGLGNVDNTSDASKPVSTATQTELNAKANSADFSNVDNTSDADKPVSTATQTALNAKADTSAVPTDLNDLSDVSIVGTPAGNQALIYDATAGAFKSQVSYTNRFEDEVEQGLYIPTIYAERGYSVKSEGDGIFIDASSDTPTAGKVIKRKIYHKTGFISDNDVIGDYTLIHTFADDTAYADTVAVFDAFEEGATYGVPPFTLFQTWEEVTAAPSFTGLLNETYGSGAEAAYSTRRLNGLYSGDCMTIRRASDSTTQSIGFVGEEIDESAIETFCSGTTCTIQVWRDQSGNGNDATQSDPTKQPTIYTGGQLVKEGGRLALDFDGTDDTIQTSSNVISNSAMSLFLTHKFDDTTNQPQDILMSSTTDGFKYGMNGAGFDQYANYNPLEFTTWANTTTSRKLDSLFAVSSGGAILYANGTLITGTGTAGIVPSNTATLKFGSRDSTSAYYDGKMQEIVLYNTDKSGTDRTDIEENVGDYFTQNTPLLDTYSGAAAAYSLRRLSSTYTGDAVEVYNGSSYANVGFNVFGELDTVALAAHCGSNSGYVSKWYSQTGSNDATQTVTGSMPKIYDGTTGVVTENGKPAVDFDGSNDSFDTNWSAGDTSALTAFNIASPTNNTTSSQLYDLRDSNNDGIRLIMFSDSDLFYSASANDLRATAYVSGQQLIFSNYANGTISTAIDGASTDTGSAPVSTSVTANATLFKDRGDTFYFNGKAQEVIFYLSDESDNRAGIETNINTFYNIYS